MLRHRYGFRREFDSARISRTRTQGIDESVPDFHLFGGNFDIAALAASSVVEGVLSLDRKRPGDNTP
ncbi:MAG: hypothetical protein GY862_06625 [Gammaproteobacteria bacterium]|nr:hypothetical protein [Gammaproteobacteria bacterium]